MTTFAEESTRQVILCPTCEGRGAIYSERLRSLYHKDSDRLTEPCKTCEGSGRLWQETTTKTMPFPR